ncbi:MAG: PorV/PorQ family protein [FCB group bacterium]|nr:PorV/PorQ family protein [FCB group bacterium]
MEIFKNKLKLTLILMLMVTQMPAVTKTGTTAAKFLSIGAGSKAISMGGAFTAIADDASAMYWNPAGIARFKSSEFLVNHTKWVADISFNYLGYVQPLRNGAAFGLNVTAVTMSEMDVTAYGSDEFTGETFSAGQYALGVSYGMQLTDRFSIGANGKYINEHISNEKASSIAIDIGTLFDTPYGFRLGTSISNFGPKMKMTGKDLLVRVDVAGNMAGDNQSINGLIDTDYFDLPLLLRVGVSGDFMVSKIAAVTWAVDALHPNDNSEYINAGAQIGFFGDQLVFRGGSKSIFMDDREERFTLGAGLNYPLQTGGTFYFDYAYELMTHLGDMHKFTLRITF